MGPKYQVSINHASRQRPYERHSFTHQDGSTKALPHTSRRRYEATTTSVTRQVRGMNPLPHTSKTRQEATAIIHQDGGMKPLHPHPRLCNPLPHTSRQRYEATIITREDADMKTLLPNLHVKRELRIQYLTRQDRDAKPLKSHVKSEAWNHDYLRHTSRQSYE